MDEKTILINTIITKMGPVLQSDQLDYLYNILTISLHDYDVTQEKNEIIEYDDFDRFLCEQYYASLKVEGKSPKTIDRYMEQLRLMMEWVQKPLKEINSEDIRYYLALYQQRRKIASSTLDGMRRCICAFYSWAEFAGYIDKSPARRIKQIKFQIKKEPALTSGQIEKAMINCNSIRDLTIGVLFESKQKGHALSAAGIRTMVHGVGERAGIERLHPHRFRVSRITHLVDRGMPLQDVQELAGHTSINTTRGYYRNTLDNVKYSYLKAAQ